MEGDSLNNTKMFQPYNSLALEMSILIRTGVALLLYLSVGVSSIMDWLFNLPGKFVVGCRLAGASRAMWSLVVAEVLEAGPRLQALRYLLS